MESRTVAEAQSPALGDPRRTRRLMLLVEALAADPMASVPRACHGETAAIKAAYRFWDAEAVTPAAIRAAHVQQTIARLGEHPLILAIQDSTELNFTAHPATTGLGPLAGRGQQGVLVHSVLGVSPDGVPLGLLAQESWTRDPEQTGSRHQRRKRHTSEKESGRWLRAQEATLAAVPPAIGVLTIADREADIYALFAAPRREDAHLLVRAIHNRRIQDAGDGEPTYVWSALRAQPPAGTVTVQVGRHGHCPDREATLTMRFQPVALQVPRHQLQRARFAPVRVIAILAQEEHPPAGQTPLCWKLVTTWPVESLADACALVEAYAFRWLIERYHFVLKSGCQVEQLQLETAERLERAFATYCLVAWRLLWLAYQARATPEAAGLAVLSPAEQAVLQASVPALGADPSLRAVVRAIAKLGGFLGRTGDGEPGVKTLWYGLQKLHLMALGWQLHQAITADSHPLTSCG